MVTFLLAGVIALAALGMAVSALELGRYRSSRELRLERRAHAALQGAYADLESRFHVKSAELALALAILERTGHAGFEIEAARGEPAARGSDTRPC